MGQAEPITDIISTRRSSLGLNGTLLPSIKHWKPRCKRDTTSENLSHGINLLIKLYTDNTRIQQRNSSIMEIWCNKVSANHVVSANRSDIGWSYCGDCLDYWLWWQQIQYGGQRSAHRKLWWDSLSTNMAISLRWTEVGCLWWGSSCNEICYAYY